MKKIQVATSTEYDVLIGFGLLSQIDRYASQVKQPCKVVVVSDSNVAPLYMETVTCSLSYAGYDVHSYVFTAGEERKNGDTYISILNFLSQNKLTRSDLLIALGGGVAGDLTGFVAATYLRGISYIQVPTSLLSMVDSSVGGKTAINLPSGKNLAGAFYQPDLVLCDTDTLKTLPEHDIRDGCAEIVKYGILYDPQLFAHLAKHGPDFDREYVISRCVELKRNVVCEDEFDTGNRQKLNLGHTIGHGIEVISDYTVSHGHAVSAGISIIGRAAVAFGYLPKSTYETIISVLRKFSLPTETEYAVTSLLPYIAGDKKRCGNMINLIIPHDIGDCKIHNIPISELKTILEAGL